MRKNIIITAQIVNSKEKFKKKILLKWKKKNTFEMEQKKNKIKQNTFFFVPSFSPWKRGLTEPGGNVSNDGGERERKVERERE
jgi:hypothetical protein